jgi:hypothetical protein
MSTPLPDRRLRLAAALGLGLMLAVVLASAAIRLGSRSAFDPWDERAVTLLRALHRTAASLEVLVALWLGWALLRGRREWPAGWRAAAIALALTAFLSAIGIASGRSPSHLAALGNLAGGLALAASFAWLLGAIGRRSAAVPWFFPAALGVLLGAQALIGGRLSIFDRVALPALPAHALAGTCLAALLVGLALARLHGRAFKLLLVAALLAPLAGFTALHLEGSALAALAHAAAAAFLIATAAWIFGRMA